MRTLMAVMVALSLVALSGCAYRSAPKGPACPVPMAMAPMAHAQLAK